MPVASSLKRLFVVGPHWVGILWKLYFWYARYSRCTTCTKNGFRV